MIAKIFLKKASTLVKHLFEQLSATEFKLIFCNFMSQTVASSFTPRATQL